MYYYSSLLRLSCTDLELLRELKKNQAFPNLYREWIRFNTVKYSHLKSLNEDIPKEQESRKNREKRNQCLLVLRFSFE